MKILTKILNIIVKIFSKKKLQCLFDITLHIILKLKGFKNSGKLEFTGEKNFLNLLKKYKIKTCLDVGAHTGSYSLELLKFNNTHVIAFEPMPESFKELQKIKNLNDKNFSCYQVALSNKKESKKIYFVNKKSQLSSMSQNLNKINFLKNNKFKYIKILTNTLDAFEKDNKKIFNKNIDFIKIDTEGNDYNVLVGARNILKKYEPKFIQVEMNYHNLFTGINLYSFHKILPKYRIYRILPDKNGLIDVDPNRPENNIYHLANYVFIHKKIKFYV